MLKSLVLFALLALIVVLTIAEQSWNFLSENAWVIMMIVFVILAGAWVAWAPSMM